VQSNSTTGTGNRYFIQALVILVRVCGGLIWASAGPLIPFLMSEYGINRGTAGWFSSSAPLTVAVVAVPLGIFLARYGLKRAFAIGAILQAAGLFAPLCTDYFPLVLTRIVFAAGTGMTTSFATAITAEWFTSREMPMMNGIMLSFVNIGNAIAFIATVPIATVFSWKAPMVSYGAFAFTCAAAWMIFGRERHGARPLTESTGKPLPEKQTGFSARKVMFHRSTLLLAFAVMGNWCIGNSMGSWLPAYYHEVFKMSLSKASSLTSIITIAGTAACILGGILSTRVGLRKPFMVVPGICMGISAISALLFNNTALIFITVACFGFFCNIQTPTIFTIPMELNKSPEAGVLILNVMQVGGTLGAFCGPLIVGYVADATGSYLPGFIICAALSLSMLAAGILLPETGPKARRPPDPA
jgi:MFS family permease